MPRSNPESWNTLSQWTSSYAAPASVPSRTYYRTYSSVNSPGYPEYLGSNPHTMDLKEQWLDSTAFWENAYVWWPPSASWASGVMDASSRGVPSDWRQHFADTASLTYRARSKLAHKVKRDEVNIAVDLAEAGQAFRMFGSTTKRIASAYRALRHGDIDGLRRSIYVKPNHSASLLRRGPLDIRRHAPSLWLELQYGWKPLLGSMYDVVTRFHQRVEEGYPIRARVSSTEVRKRSGSGTTSGVVAYDASQTQRSRMSLQVDYWVDMAAAANLNDWGLTNPLEVAWELVPYSFVVDWFIPVGDYLSTIDAYLGVTFKQGFEGLVRVTTGEAKYKKAPGEPTNGSRKWTVRGTDSFKHVTYTRNVLTSFPRAGLPRLKNPFSPLHAANAISLLSLAFDKKR